MLNSTDILETIKMIQEENLDIRTITMGISLLDCIDSDIDKACDKVYDKIMRKAENLVKTGEDIEKQYGIPIVNKRISGYAYRDGLRCVQGQPREVREGAPARCRRHRRKLSRRLLRACPQGILRRRPGAYPVHSGGSR